MLVFTSNFKAISVDTFIEVATPPGEGLGPFGGGCGGMRGEEDALPTSE